jgi:hypothetical protein
MTKGVARILALSMLLNLLSAFPLFAQSKHGLGVEKTKSKVLKRGTGGKPITVRLTNNTKTKGQITEIKDDYFVLTSKGGITSNIYYDQVNDIDKAFSKTEMTIAVIGAGFGFGVIAVCFIGRKCQD